MKPRVSVLLVTTHLIIAVSAAHADIQSQTIVVDLEKETISPGAPTINIAANPSVVIDILPSKCTYKIVPGYATLQTKRLGPQAMGALRQSLGALPDSVSRANLLAAVDRATGQEKESVAKAVEQTVTLASSIVLNFERGMSAQAIRDTDSDHLWKITLLEHHQDYTVEVTPQGGTLDLCKQQRPYYVVIHVDAASFELNWSAGFAVSSLRDERFRLDPVDGQPDKLAIVANGHQGPPSNLIALAHYCYAKPTINWLCLSSGLGTDLPSTGVLLLTGIATRLKPIQSANAFYITAAATYGHHKVLGDDYSGRQNPRVPSGTTSASLLTNRYTVGFALGISYGFLGSEDKFKSVYSKTGTTSEPVTSGSNPKKQD